MLDADTRVLQGTGNEWAIGRRVTRDQALAELGAQGWHHAVNLSNVLDDALGHADTYDAVDVLVICGIC